MKLVTPDVARRIFVRESTFRLRERRPATATWACANLFALLAWLLFRHTDIASATWLACLVVLNLGFCYRRFFGTANCVFAITSQSIIVRFLGPITPFVATRYSRSTPRFVQFDFSEVNGFFRWDHLVLLPPSAGRESLTREWLALKVSPHIQHAMQSAVWDLFEKRPKENIFLTFDWLVDYDEPGALSFTWELKFQPDSSALLSTLKRLHLPFDVTDGIKKELIDLRGYLDMNAQDREAALEKMKRARMPFVTAAFMLRNLGAKGTDPT
jgi:hypothetical protein